LISDEDEAGIKDYDKFDDWFLEHNWVIMLPGGGRIAIPMPYGLNAFYNTGRSISSAIRRNALDHYGAYDVGDASKSIRNTLLEVVNPLGGTEHFLSWASPTIADPFISLYGTNIGYDEKDIRKEAFPGPARSRIAALLEQYISDCRICGQCSQRGHWRHPCQERLARCLTGHFGVLV
jgi:hypothetical protein